VIEGAGEREVRTGRGGEREWVSVVGKDTVIPLLSYVTSYFLK
jgi:hypothetical protein